MNILCCGGRSDVVEKVSSSKRRPVLMDIQMPRLDGIEATGGYVPWTVSTTKLPIVGLSANVHRADIDEALKSGMNGYVTKPFVAAELFTVLVSLIGDGVVRYKVEDLTDDGSIESTAPVIRFVDTQKGIERVGEQGFISKAST